MPILGSANDILIDINGNVAYLTDDELFEYDANDATESGANLLTNSSDLGEPTIDKLLNQVDVDYIGAFDLYIYFDDVQTYKFEFPVLLSRATSYKDFPTLYRKAFQKLKFKITSLSPTTKIYGIEVDFSVLKRRKYN